MRKLFCMVLVLSGLTLSALTLTAQTQVTTQKDAVGSLDGVPGPLIWQHAPAQWKIDGGKTLSITGGKQTNWFADPFGGAQTDNSPRLLFKPAEDFVLSAKVTTDFHTQWDAGVLAMVVNDSLWAKLCFEMTIEKHPAIVSVVTRGISDDNNSIAIHGNTVYLRIIKTGSAIFFSASEDGKQWSIIRTFTLGKNPDLRIGFSSQSPAGDRCTTTFSEIQYLPKKVNPWTGE